MKSFAPFRCESSGPLQIPSLCFPPLPTPFPCPLPRANRSGSVRDYPTHAQLEDIYSKTPTSLSFGES